MVTYWSHTNHWHVVYGPHTNNLPQQLFPLYVHANQLSFFGDLSRLASCIHTYAGHLLFNIFVDSYSGTTPTSLWTMCMCYMQPEVQFNISTQWRFHPSHQKLVKTWVEQTFTIVSICKCMLKSLKMGMTLTTAESLCHSGCQESPNHTFPLPNTSEQTII